MTPSEREALRKAAGEATEGPWVNSWCAVWSQTDMTIDTDPALADTETPEDATYIAAADPPTILALLDALDSSEAEVRHLRKELAWRRSSAVRCTYVGDNDERRFRCCLVEGHPSDHKDFRAVTAADECADPT